MFPEVDLGRIHPERNARTVIARVLEFGRMADVAWCVRQYGLDRIHQFFRDESDPSVSPKTIAAWRLVLDAKGEPWATSRRLALRKFVPWPG